MNSTVVNVANVVKALALAFLLLLGSAASGRQTAAPAGADPALEQRVNALASELRCLVCQNETIAESTAPLAVDLKNQVREQMKQGISDQEIFAFMVARYGDFVLYRPPFKANTLLLWLGPLLLLAAGLFTLFFNLTRRRAPENELGELGEAERARAAKLLAAGSESDKP